MTEPLYTENSSEIRDDVPVLFLAVGHAGTKLIAHLPSRVPELAYAAVDTDSGTLRECTLERKLLLSVPGTAEMGSGGDPKELLRVADSQEDEIRALFQESKVVVIVAGLGGTTGGVLGPRIAEIARESGLMVMAALSQPLAAEGGERRTRSEDALHEFRELCHGVMLFPLESLRAREDEGMLLPRLLKRCGLEVSRSLGGLAVLIRSGWLLPLTLADVSEMLRKSEGYCRLVAVSSDTDNRIQEVLDQLFAHPLIDNGSLLAHSGGVVLGILCGPQTLLTDLERISQETRNVLRSDASFKIGVSQDERFGQYLGLVVMVAERWSTVLPARGVEEESGLETLPQTETDEDGELIQSEIDLSAPTAGRFKGIQPTIEEGADLDTPTFIRKGIRLSFHRKPPS